MRYIIGGEFDQWRFACDGEVGILACNHNHRTRIINQVDAPASGIGSADNGHVLAYRSVRYRDVFCLGRHPRIAPVCIGAPIARY